MAAESDAAKGAYDEWHINRSKERAPQGDGLYSWHRNVARLMKVVPNARILEIGCGRGEFGRWLAARHPHNEITCVDFSSDAIDIANRAAADRHPNLKFEVADATALRFADSSFDIVVSCECIEHVLRPEAMASEIRRVLHADGAFYLTTENYFNGMILMWIRTWITGLPIDTGSGIQPHENFFLFWRVRRMLERSGLRVEHTESDHFQWLMLPRVSPGKLCTADFENPALKRFFKPFGRHFLFAGSRRP